MITREELLKLAQELEDSARMDSEHYLRDVAEQVAQKLRDGVN